MISGRSPSRALTRRELVALATAAGGALAARGLPAPAVAAAARVRRYDDGTRAIPGGVAGDPERVIVVGAGWAGLTLANALRAAGVDRIVVEARERVGGRAHTVELAGAPVDLGCSWIHQPYGNPMSRFARQAGIRRLRADVELDALIIRFFDAHLGRELRLGEKLAAFAHAMAFGYQEAGRIGRVLGPHASVADGARAYLDRRRIAGDARRQAEFVMRAFSEFVSGDDWHVLSLGGWAWSEHPSPYFGLGQGDFPRGGYRGLIRAMTGTEDVRLGHRVDTIEVRSDGVTARGEEHGRRFALHGSHVVVTVPLGVLKAGAIAFDPPLPAAKRDAIVGLGFGAVEKIAMVFEEPFWSDRAHTHAVYLAAGADLDLPYFVDLHRIARVPGLVAFSGGPFARHVAALSPNEAVDLAHARLREMLGRDVPRPIAAAATSWHTDPASLGAYSNIRVGRTAADCDVLAEPVAGRLLFAGEATNRVRHALADGALSSGIREAKRLLRRSAVTLAAG